MILIVQEKKQEMLILVKNFYLRETSFAFLIVV